MGARLVDYSSDSASDPDPDHSNADGPPAAKKRKTSTTTPPITSNTTTLPPLPSSFHDLYASTVRTAPTDLPALHQGRHRTTPHQPGVWPSHLYLEWHPPPPQHATLASLIEQLSAQLPAASPPLYTFLTSDLGAPLPLHISLSRPLVLRTEEKDRFLEDAVKQLTGTSLGEEGGVVRLRVDGLGWFRGPDSERAFMVLRVRSAVEGRGRNPELAALLRRCNELVAEYGQPRLYARSGGEEGKGKVAVPGGREENGDGETTGPVNGKRDQVDDGAFHVSIAWSFVSVTDELRQRTAAVFAQPEFQRDIVDGISMRMNGVKVKIGNVVTNVPLSGTAAKGGRAGRSLFGI